MDDRRLQDDVLRIAQAVPEPFTGGALAIARAFAHGLERDAPEARLPSGIVRIVRAERLNSSVWLHRALVPYLGSEAAARAEAIPCHWRADDEIPLCDLLQPHGKAMEPHLAEARRMGASMCAWAATALASWLRGCRTAACECPLDPAGLERARAARADASATPFNQRQGRDVIVCAPEHEQAALACALAAGRPHPAVFAFPALAGRHEWFLLRRSGVLSPRPPAPDPAVVLVIAVGSPSAIASQADWRWRLIVDCTGAFFAMDGDPLVRSVVRCLPPR